MPLSDYSKMMMTIDTKRFGAVYGKVLRQNGNKVPPSALKVGKSGVRFCIQLDDSEGPISAVLQSLKGASRSGNPVLVRYYIEGGGSGDATLVIRQVHPYIEADGGQVNPVSVETA